MPRMPSTRKPADKGGSLRDPVSTWFDAAAIRYLERAYASEGEWTGVYLAPPTVAQRARLAVMGVDPWERDRWGEVRWVRAFKRSVFWNLKKFGYAGGLRPGEFRASNWPAKSLEWETGSRVLKSGWPSRRWALRIRLHATGQAAHLAAAHKVPEGKRWIDKSGHVTERQSTVADRDWLGVVGGDREAAGEVVGVRCGEGGSVAWLAPQ